MDDYRFDRVHLKWLPKLMMLTLDMWISQQDPLSFGYVPLLRSLSLMNTGLSWHKMLKLNDFLGNFTISSLQLKFKSEKVSQGDSFVDGSFDHVVFRFNVTFVVVNIFCTCSSFADLGSTRRSKRIVTCVPQTKT